MRETPRVGPLRVALREQDQRRVTAALTAFAIGDRAGFDAVLEGVADDPQKTAALLLGVVQYATYVVLGGTMPHDGGRSEPW